MSTIDKLRRKTLYYRLDGKTVVPCADFAEWSLCWVMSDRRVARSVIDHWVVSTVFLGIDHDALGHGPELFETMVFADGRATQYRMRCATWDQAEHQHAIAELLVRDVADTPQIADHNNSSKCC